MIKYKLIKEYPGSPKLGTIVKQHEIKEHLFVSDCNFAINHPYYFPEFWEEIEESLTNDTDSHSWGFENFEVIKTEEDAKIFVETMENIPEPNDKLKKTFKDFNKQETLEYGLLQHIKFCLECKNDSQAIRLIEKYGFEKQEGRYSLDELRLWLIERDVYLHNYYTTYKKSGIPMESVDKYIEDSHEYLMGRKKFKKR